MSTTTDALQQALAAEHAAIWAYGEVGARSSDALVPEVAAVQQAHRVRRDAAEQLLLAAGEQPVASLPSYTLAAPVTDPASALTVAASVEDGVAAAWRYVLGRTSSAQVRAVAGPALTDSAVQALRWRVVLGAPAEATQPFPGA